MDDSERSSRPERSSAAREDPRPSDVASQRAPDFEYDEDVPSMFAISKDVPDLCCCYDHKIGRMYVLSRTSMNVVVGPCWPMIFVTSFLILTVPALLSVFLLIRLHVACVVFVAVCTAVTWGAYLCTACKNPGVFPKHYVIPEDAIEDGWSFNGKTQSYRYVGKLRIVVSRGPATHASPGGSLSLSDPAASDTVRNAKCKYARSIIFVRGPEPRSRRTTTRAFRSLRPVCA